MSPGIDALNAEFVGAAGSRGGERRPLATASAGSSSVISQMSDSSARSIQVSQRPSPEHETLAARRPAGGV